MRWCWNRRAPARCSEFAIRRSPPPSPCLSTPQKISAFRRQHGFPGIELLALLVDCQILFKVDAANGDGLRAVRGRRQPRSLGFSRSSVPHAQHGRPAGQPARRTLSLCGSDTAATGGATALAWKENRSAQGLGRRLRKHPRRSRGSCMNVIRRATSTTSRPITLAELARFLDSAARIQAKWKDRVDLGDGGPDGLVRRQAVSVGRQRLRARALSGGCQLRRTCARLLSLRRRPARAGADRRTARQNSKRSWRPPNLPWARPPRPRS